MKKIIIVAVILLTAGLLTATITKSNDVKTTKVIKAEIALNNNILGTAD
jgi:hypothetical protein